MDSRLKSAMGSYVLLIALPSLTTALRAPFAAETIPVHGQLLPKYPQPTASFDDNEFHAAVRRDTSGSLAAISTSLTSSYAPASLCGWTGDGSGSDVYCGQDQKCVFHASNSVWPGMGGCCPNNDDTDCTFETICYDNSAISATPSLTSSYNPFAVYCTGSSQTACVTWFYTQLGISDYGCGTSAGVETLYTDWTVTPTASGYDAYVSMVSVSYVPDELVSAYANGFSTMSTTDVGKVTSSAAETTSTKPNPSTPPAAKTAAASSSSSSSGSSTPVGAIVGGVVGGVVGLGAIAGACFVAWLWMKKKRDNNDAEMTPQGNNNNNNNNGPAGYQSVPQYQQQQPPVSEAGGEEVKEKPTELYAPGPIPEHHEPVEIDSQSPETFIELPASESRR